MKPSGPHDGQYANGWNVCRPSSRLTGRPGDLRADLRAFGRGLRAQLEHAPPRFGIVVVLRERERDRPADRRREPAHPVHLAIGRGEILAERAGRRELEHTGSELAEHRADAEQLVFGGERARHRLAVDGHVHDRAAGREARTRRRRCRRGRSRPSPRCRRASRARCARRARPSRSRAPRRAAPACRRRAPSASCSTASRYSGNDSQPHWMPGRERGAGDVFDALHQPDQPLVLVGRGGREPDTAVAHHDRGDAVPARRREQRIPGDLAVEVRVHVDEPGRDDERRRRRASRARAPVTRPTSVTTPSVIATSAVRGAAPVPSTTSPPLTTRSCMKTSLPIVQRTVRKKARTSSIEEIGLLERGEVAATVEPGPAGDVVERLGPRSRHLQDLAGERARSRPAPRPSRTAGRVRCAATRSRGAPTS